MTPEENEYAEGNLQASETLLQDSDLSASIEDFLTNNGTAVEPEEPRLTKASKTRTRLVATILSLVCALSLMAVGVYASSARFTVNVSNAVSLDIKNAEGVLWGSRYGDVVFADGENVGKTAVMLSSGATEVAEANGFAILFDNANGGEQTSAINGIEAKVDFLPSSDIVSLVNERAQNGQSTSVSISYLFYFERQSGAVGATKLTLTAPALTDDYNGRVVVNNKYIYKAGKTMPTATEWEAAEAFSSAVVNETNTGIYILAEVVVDLSKSIRLDNLDWQFTLTVEGVNA